MDKHFFADQPVQLWNELQLLIAKRAEGESTIALDYAEEKKRIERQFRETEEKTKKTQQAARSNLETEYTTSRRSIVDRYDSKYKTLQQKYRQACDEAKAACQKVNAAENQKLKESRWEAQTVYEATKDEPGKKLAKVKQQLAAHHDELVRLKRQADELIERRWKKPDELSLQPTSWPTDADPAERLGMLLTETQRQLTELHHQHISSLFEGGHLFGLIPLFLLVCVVPFGLILGWTAWIWMLVGAVVGLGLWGGLYVWLARQAHQQLTDAYTPLCQTIVDAGQAIEKIYAAAQLTCKQEEAAIGERLRMEMQEAKDRFEQITNEARRCRDTELEKAEVHYPPRLKDANDQREIELGELDQLHARQMKQFEQACVEEIEKNEKAHVEAVADVERRHEDSWSEMAERWRSGMKRLEEEVDQLNETERALFFDWTASDVSAWKPSDTTPYAVPFGHVTLDMASMEDGIPADKRLVPGRTKFTLPASFAFPDQSLLFTASGEGRDKAIETIQTLMLRLLTGTRPGKVRFTVIDPVGLGESFSAFMHLADFDEQVITSRIWTESSHIEKQLVNLTEHMENVIQVYLRNEFETIQQYNDFAGEMAEPYRVLVVANFPANFTESAARRLMSIITSGARCGVYVLLSVDKRVPMPHGFMLSDLESQMLQLDWQSDRFVWKGSELSQLPLTLDSPPEPKAFTELVRTVGEKVLDVDRVEVPFEFVVPGQEDWWKGDSSRELVIPLGRAGAMKLQYLNLGRGTAQHVLVAGKTGSGKSNLLHAIITSMALWYSPDQAELYLVDFKKGVEFKPYAEFHLPHAKVIAVESEREFGLSVLEHLDAELKRRGDRFRQVGVQDLAGWRRERPDEKMPRVVLVIDEFQELFTEDDRIGQSAAQLLDRLVRQGRAFGMHVMLGSQTLAGAYSLPRATIGQMAVRIALQCSESDAHLILSEENTAARLLTRPGEAIYNDANGLFEGNHPFQVVWLPDHQRTRYLQLLDDWTQSQNCHPEPPIVFEGNASADVRQNRLLEKTLFMPSAETASCTSAQAWLGSAVAIKDPTSVTFQRQGGSNMLLVGHNEESVLGILGTTLISLAAQTPVREEEAATSKESASKKDDLATFYVLNGMRPESPEIGFWPRFCKVLPQKVCLADSRQTATVLGRITEELSRRQEQGIGDGPAIYLVIYDLGRFRELRREEDSFRFSSMGSDEPPKPSAQLTQILKEGPGLGIHTIVWCDTCNTMGRWLERQSIHDFEMRVAFQMSAGDSSTLLDSAEAGRLGAHRAIYYNEGLGQMEKFRPYGIPSVEWLAQVKKQLALR